MNRSLENRLDPKKAKWFFGFVVIATTLIAHRGIVSCDFLDEWDDKPILLANENFRGLSWENLRWMLTTTDFPASYIPLSWIAWGTTYLLCGMNPRGYHLLNLLLHAGCAALAYILIVQILEEESDGNEKKSGNWIFVYAALGALIWSLHPLRVEPIAFASCLVYLLATLFALASFLFYWKDACAARKGERRGAFYPLAVVSFAASMLSYPLGLGLAVVFPLIDWHPFGRLQFGFNLGQKRSALRAWLEKIPFLAIAFLAGVVTLITHKTGSVMGHLPSLKGIGLFARAMQAFYLWAYYLWVFWTPLRLTPLNPVLIDFNPLAPTFVLSAVLVIGATILLFARRVHWRSAWVLWASHLVLLLPVLGIHQNPHFPSDRHSYLQGILWGIALALALSFLHDQPAWRKFRKEAVGVIFLACVGLGWASARQGLVWRDSVSLFHAILGRIGPHHPCSEDVLLRLAVMEQKRGHYDLTKQALDTVLEGDPQSAFALRLRGRARLALGDLVGAEEDFEKTLAQDSSDHEVVRFYGKALALQGRYEEAAARFSSLLGTPEEDARLHFDLATALLKSDHAAEALSHYEQAIRMNPQDADAYFNAAIALERLGRVEEAQEKYRRAAQLNPQDPEPQKRLHSLENHSTIK